MKKIIAIIVAVIVVLSVGVYFYTESNSSPKSNSFSEYVSLGNPGGKPENIVLQDGWSIRNTTLTSRFNKPESTIIKSIPVNLSSARSERSLMDFDFSDKTHWTIEFGLNPEKNAGQKNQIIGGFAVNRTNSEEFKVEINPDIQKRKAVRIVRNDRHMYGMILSETGVWEVCEALDTGKRPIDNKVYFYINNGSEDKTNATDVFATADITPPHIVFSSIFPDNFNPMVKERGIDNEINLTKSNGSSAPKGFNNTTLFNFSNGPSNLKYWLAGGIKGMRFRVRFATNLHPPSSFETGKLMFYLGGNGPENGRDNLVEFPLRIKNGWHEHQIEASFPQNWVHIWSIQLYRGKGNPASIEISDFHVERIPDNTNAQSTYQVKPI